MTVFAGQGDIRRSVGLLWRRPGTQRAKSTVGRKASLSVDVVISAGIAIADSDGLDSVSMRAVGDRLGRTGMALYTYVPSKSELVDLMYDKALAELPSDYDLDSGWRPALTAWATDLCEFYIRHPWTLQLSTARPVLGPNEYHLMNTIVGILFRTGLEVGLMRRIVGLLFHCVRGSAQTITDARRAADATGVTDENWWAEHSAALNEYAPDFATRFPMVIKLETEAITTAATATTILDDVPHQEREARETFDVGLTVLLNGVAQATMQQPTGD